MSTQEFYDQKRVFQDIVRRDLRYARADWVFGPVCVLIGFFWMRTMGRYPTWNVVLPFWVITVLMSGITFYTVFYEVRGLTARFYRNLPRDRSLVWDAHAAFLFGFAAYLEGFAMVGVFLKLGSGGLIDAQRLHPEWMVLPLYSIVVTLWGIAKPCGRSQAIHLLGVLGLSAVPVLWFFREWNLHAKDISQTPAFPLAVDLAFAAVLMATAAILYWNARRTWKHPESGE